MKKLSLIGACLFFSACTTTTDSINKAIKSADEFLSGNTTQSEAQPSRTRLRDTKAAGMFTRSQSEEWPRAAVTIKQLPNWFYQMPPSGMMGGHSSKDCILIKLTIWQNSKSNESIDDIKFCGDDIVKNTPYADVGTGWVSFGGLTTKQNTGNRRTEGPVAPRDLFPKTPGTDSFFLVNGSYYLGGIMATLGYNWKDRDDRRFWVVSVPSQADVARQRN